MTYNGLQPLNVNAGRNLPGFGRKLGTIGKLNCFACYGHVTTTCYLPVQCCFPGVVEISKFFCFKSVFIYFITVKIGFIPQIQKVNLECKGTFQLPGLLTVDVKDGQILARTEEKSRFHIRVLDTLGKEMSIGFPSKCNHILGSLITHPSEAGFVLESCPLCKVIRNYNIHTGQCTFVYKSDEPWRICQSPKGSILASSFSSELSMLKLDKENNELCSVKRVYLEDTLYRMCYSELFNMLVVVMYNQNEIKALKLEGEGATLKLSDPLWKLSGEVDGQVIKANAITTDNKGNIYIADEANNRILKINGLTGDAVTTLQLEETNKDIDSLFWSDTELGLIVTYRDEISSYNIPNFD